MAHPVYTYAPYRVRLYGGLAKVYRGARKVGECFVSNPPELEIIGQRECAFIRAEKAAKYAAEQGW